MIENIGENPQIQNKEIKHRIEDLTFQNMQNLLSNILYENKLQSINFSLYQNIMKKVLILSLILVFTFCWTQASAIRKCQTSNCQVCSSIGVCVMCQPGHLLSINKQLMASQCVAQKCQVKNCFRCVTENICAQCETGFSLGLKSQCVKENALKKEVQNMIENCKKISADGKCEQCLTGLKLMEGKCLGEFLNLAEVEQTSCSQITNCNTCIGSNFCTSCSSGFVPSASGSTCITNCTISNCLLCSSSLVCSACQNGYTLFLGSCVIQNIPNCMTYSPITSGTCSACYLAYSLTNDNTQCSYSGCYYPCATCNYTTSPPTCLTCAGSFNSLPLSNGTCFTCLVPNCVSCNSSTNTTCLACGTGYTLLTDGSCSYNCQSQFCQTCGAEGCITCVQGYNLLSNGTCQACNVTYCASCTGNNECLACMPGFFLGNNNVCNTCNVTGCATCTEINNCLTYQANTGFLPYTLANGTVLPYICDIGCASCAPNFPLQCLQCSAGYYMQINSTTTLAQCFPCSPNCVTCTNATSCTACASNSYYNATNNNCTACNTSSNCLTCTITYDKNDPITSCTGCQPGFVLYTNSTGFGFCQTPCPVNCRTCFNSTNGPQNNTLTNNVSCSACNPGFGLTVGGFCVPCLANCRVCSGQQPLNCISCGSGFYLNSVNQTSPLTCMPCPAGCATCTATNCLSCFSQFVLTNNSTTNTMICTQTCPYPCASCLPNINTLCQSCLLGFYLYPKNNSCLLNPNATLPGSTTVYCGFGTYYNAGNSSCLPCGTNCLRCVAGSANTCTSCMYGFYLAMNNNTCQACNSTCLACSSQNTCLTCKPNYALVNLPLATNQIYCSLCSTPCLQCTSNPQECTSCLPGFTFIGFNCVSNFYYIFTITVSANQQTFYNNYPLFMAQVLKGLTTQNMRATLVNSIVFNSSANSSGTGSVTVNMNLSTFVTSNSDLATYQYNNLQFTLLSQSPFGNMKVLSRNVVSNGVIPQLGSNIPMICGIVIPIGVVLLVGLLYCMFSRNNIDLPGSDYVPLEKTAPTKMTELKSIQ